MVDAHKLVIELMHKTQRYLDYDPVALAVLFAGLSMIGLFVFI